MLIVAVTIGFTLGPLAVGITTPVHAECRTPAARTA
jgi:hypothetical protein